MVVNSRLIKGYIAILLAIIGWGLSSSFIDFGLDYISPLPFMALRFILASLIFTPFILIYKRKETIFLIKNKWPWIIATFESLGLFFQYTGQQSVDAGLATLISLQFLVFVPMLTYFLLKQKFTLIQLIATISALIGVFLLATNGNIQSLANSINIGVIILLLSALSYSFYIISSSWFSNSSNVSFDVISLFYIVILLIGMYSAIFSFATEPVLQFDPQIWIWVLALALFSTLLAFSTYFYSLKFISANKVALLLVTQVTIPIFVDITILNISYSLWAIIGGLIILFAILLVVLEPFIDSINNKKEKSILMNQKLSENIN